MRILILQFIDPRSDDGLPVFSQSLGVLSSLLKQEGLEVRLEALSGHQPHKIHEAVIAGRPGWIVADLSTRSYPWARRNLITVGERYQIPVLAVGQYATCKSRRALSIPGVQALVRGEYEVGACEFLSRQARQEFEEAENVPGLWSRMDGRLTRNELEVHPRNWQNLPFADRVIFETAQSVEATGELPFSAVKGCPQWCAFCINDWYLDLYPKTDRFLRRREVDDLIEEIVETVATYPRAKRVAFLNHAFAMDPEWLERFASAYPIACQLPTRCHVRLNALTPHVVSLLARCRCRQVHTQIGCASDFIRNEILNMRTGREQIFDGVEQLKEAGIRVSADVFIGAPYETEITVEETVNMIGQLGLDDVCPKVFHPLAGTRAADLCAENGWISGRGLMGYWQQESILDMPSLPAGLIRQLHRKLPSLIGTRRKRQLRKILQRSRRKR